MKISNSVEIQAPPEKVFYWLENPDRAMKWMTSVTKSEIIKETPDRIGTTFREFVEENGRGTEMHGVVTNFIANKQFSVHLEGEFNLANVNFTLEEKMGVTLLTQDVDLRFKGLLKILTLFRRSSIKKGIMNQSQREFGKLKELCEQNENNNHRPG